MVSRRNTRKFTIRKRKKRGGNLAQTAYNVATAALATPAAQAAYNVAITALATPAAQTAYNTAQAAMTAFKQLPTSQKIAVGLASHYAVCKTCRLLGYNQYNPACQICSSIGTRIPIVKYPMHHVHTALYNVHTALRNTIEVPTYNLGVSAYNRTIGRRINYPANKSKYDYYRHMDTKRTVHLPTEKQIDLANNKITEYNRHDNYTA